MATIKDVALEAGVSIGTVSNYLNRKTNISEKTAKKITEAIQKLNYVVQSSGRELRQGKINVLGVIFPNISEPYFEKVISSIKGYMDLHGSRYSIEIALTDHNPEKEETVLLNYIVSLADRKYFKSWKTVKFLMFSLIEDPRSWIAILFIWTTMLCSTRW